MRYSAFISYNHRDKRWATWLHRALEQYRIPNHLRGREGPFGPIGDRLPPVFRDRDELATSADLAESVKQALGEAETLVVVCSPDAARSRWVDEEVRTFIALGRRDKIRLIIVDGEPHSADPERECLPPAIRAMDAEPLAADVRPGQDGRAAARLKLIAGILELPYDELRQREAQRRQKRLAAIAIASTIGFLLMGGLAVYALLTRAEAVRQHELAQQRTLTAERTLEFVKQMFRVADPSEAQGEEISAREVVDRGAAMLSGDLDEEPAVKAELAVTLSEVYGALGLYQRSDQLIRESFGVRHDQRGIMALQWAALGESQSRLGDYAAAIRSFGLAAAALPEADVATEALRARILIGLGEARSAQGEFDSADQSIRAALALDRRRLGENHPNVARDLEALALNHADAGEFDEARPLVLRALRLRLDLEGRNSPSVADNLNLLGSLAYQSGDLATAERYFSQNVAFDRRVLGPDHPDSASTLNNLARVQIEQRKFAEAAPLLEEAVRVGVGERGETHDDMAFFFSNLALARRYTGRMEEAEQLFERALVAAREHEHRTLGPILADLAEVRCRTGRAPAGLAMLDEARTASASDYPDDPWRTAWVENIRGECLIRAGRAPEGRALIARSSPIILERWLRTTLFGAEAARRSRI